MSLVAINWMVQKIKEIYYRSVKQRVAGKRGDDEQCLQAMKLRRLRKFSQPGNFSGKILLPQHWNTCNNTRPKIMRR